MDNTFSNVSITGRLGTRIDVREMPSGDEIIVFSIVVDRPPSPRSHSTAKVDTLPCQSLRRDIRKRVEGLEPGTLVEASGQLRRRFWRAGSGLGSALEIEVDSLRKARPGTS